MLRFGVQVGQTLEGYRFVRVLGHGARAMVWEAIHVSTRRRVAVKVLETLDPHERKRLAAEYKALDQLDHPNVVGVHALLEIEGHLALVQDLILGPDLATRLAEQRFSTDEALRLFGGLLRGLHAAHTLGMVHRDLKPGNILLTDDQPPLLRIADFGIVKFDDSDLTTNGMVIGTFRYMAPEQLRNPRGVDARADLFSAGCILFELATGQKAFEAPNKVALMNAVRKKAHQPFPEDLPANFRTLIERALEPDPDLRPASAADMLKELDLPMQTAHSVPVVRVAVGQRNLLYASIGAAIVVALYVLWRGLYPLLMG